MRRLLPSLILLHAVIAPAHADLFGIQESQTYIQLVQLLKVAQEQLEQAKKAYEVSSEIYLLSQSESQSLDRILNTQLVDIMREKGWMVDGLDALRGVADIDRQINYMMQLMADAKDAETREQLQYTIDLLRQQRTVMKLAAQTDKNLGKAVKDVDERESSRITAENTAILARQALAEQNRINQLAAQQKAAVSDQRRFAHDAAKLYRKLGGR